jgi:recombination protein RecA
MSDSVKKLQEAFDKINKTYEAGTVGVLGKMEHQDIEKFSTGSLQTDLAIGGGWPRGRIIEVYGPESSGKTTLAIHAMAEIQKIGGRAGIIDMEHAFDKEYASNLGVDVDNLVFSQPDTGEQCWEILEILLDSGELDLLVVDSIAAMTPKRELEGEMGDAVIGLQAKMMAQGLRKNTGRIKKSNCTVIFINQIRDNVGVIYGPSEVTTGGKSMKFYASIRCEVRRVEQVKKGEEVIANKTRVKVVKNKVAPPFKQAFFNIAFGEGIDRTTEILDAAVELDIIKRGGSWYSYGETKLGQGLPNVKLLLLDNPELLEEIEEKVMDFIHG